ncbi:MAG: asparagine synthase [Gammaproteobacteria bacterium]|nr:asparagine synthase [Gammaproteobacteria bacterium]
MDQLAGWAGWHAAEKPSKNLLHDLLQVAAEREIKNTRITSGHKYGLAGTGFSPPIFWEDEEFYAFLLGRQCRFTDGESEEQQSELLGSWLKQHRNDPVKGLVALKGDFCLVLVNRSNNDVLLAVDRMGVQPLAYSQSGDCLVFASSCEQIKQHPIINVSVSNQSIFDYLYFHMIPSPNTIYNEIKKLEPAQYLYFRSGEISTGYYWQPDFSGENYLSENELTPALKRCLETAVRRCDVNEKTGAFLSGGLDSSTVAGFASRVSQSPVSTYSIGFDAPGYDEISYARIASSHFSTKGHEYYVTPDDVLKAVPLIASSYDEPFGNSSAIPVYFCARLAFENGSRRLLAGDGGDELFAGNSRYAKQKIFEVYQHTPALLRHMLIEPILSHMPSRVEIPIISKLGRYVRDAKIPLPARLQRYNFLQRTPLENVFTVNFLNEVNRQHPAESLDKVYSRVNSDSFLNRMLFMDWKQTLADNDLRKVNKMCALAGIEVCYPMLDDDLVELSTRIPPALKLKGRKLRYFFKQTLADFLPPEILTKGKHGFGLPFGVWLKEVDFLQKLAKDTLYAFGDRGYVNRTFIDWLFVQHNSVHPAYYGEMIWVIMMLELWLQSHID